MGMLVKLCQLCSINYVNS